eukprot:TRINITY_DN37620_c0_g1_i1.p1 TRINITY_DN37620_c0_g1~~TRINITY_DN37620_c0_g1_i1.p1  ORF type:complete len:942 (+),score=130.99 TRINITY_DN37620_c0_g1_i1:108-2933(+)
MEVCFWHYLFKDGPDALPLKQRIPELALFRGSNLEACYFSNQRGVLLRRSGDEATRGTFLGRLLGLAPTTPEQTGVGSRTPAAILRRRSAPTISSAPPQDAVVPSTAHEAPRVTVLSVSDVISLLEQRGGHCLADADEWSLQSVVVPAEDVRLVAIYSRDKLGEERLDIVGRKYRTVYQLGDTFGPPQLPAEAPIVVSEARAVAVEGKVLSLVRYVQRFHRRFVESLIAEFLIDNSGRVILNAFWKVTFFNEVDRPIPLEIMRADRLAEYSGAAALGCSMGLDASVELGSAEPHSHSSSTTVPTGMLASTSTDFGGFSRSVSRPTSAGPLSRPTSASGGQSLHNASIASSVGRVGIVAATTADRGHRTEPHTTDLQDVEILEDDAEGDSDIDEAIERIQASAPSRSAHARPRVARAQSSGWPKSQTHVGFGASRSRSGASRPRPFSAIARLQSAAEARASLAAGRDSGSCGRDGGVASGDGGGVTSSIGSAPVGTSADAPTNSHEAEGRTAPVVRASDASATAYPSTDVKRPSRPPPVTAGPRSMRQPRPQSRTKREFQRSPSTTKVHVPTTKLVAKRPSSARPATQQSVRSFIDGISRGQSGDVAANLGDGGRHSPQRRVVYSQQLLSRHQREKDACSRLLSTFARQLERYRDILPVLVEQRDVVQIVVARSEKVLLTKGFELERAQAERQRVDRDYAAKMEALAKCMKVEHEKVRSSAEKRQRDLGRSLQLEQETTQVLKDEEEKNKALRSSLDQTMKQLHAMQTETSDNNLHADGIKDGTGLSKKTPEVIHALDRIEAISSEKQLVASETSKAQGDILRVQEELNRQRAYSLRLEAFVRDLSASSGKFILDPATRREATMLLKAAAQVRSRASTVSGIASAVDSCEGGTAACGPCDAASASSSLSGQGGCWPPWKIWGPPQQELFAGRRAPLAGVTAG